MVLWKITLKESNSCAKSRMKRQFASSYSMALRIAISPLGREQHIKLTFLLFVHEEIGNDVINLPSISGKSRNHVLLTGPSSPLKFMALKLYRIQMV